MAADDVKRNLLRRHGAHAAAAVLVLALYAAALAWLPRGVFWHPDEGGKLIQMLTTRWTGEVDAAAAYPGIENDPSLSYYPGLCSAGIVYPLITSQDKRLQWSPWFPLISQPFFARFGWLGLFVVPLLSGWLTAVLAGVLVRTYRPGLAPLTTLLAGLATPVWFYSLTFSEHTPATLLGIAALCLAVRPGGLAVWLAPPFLALAAMMRVEMLAFALALPLGLVVSDWLTRPPAAVSASTVRHRRSRYAIAVAAVLGAVGVAAFIWSLTGRHVEGFATFPDAIRATRWKLQFLFPSLRRFLINAPGLEAAKTTVMAESVAFVALLACFAAPFIRGRRVASIVTLMSLAIVTQISFVITIANRPYISRQGLFVVAPFLAVALFAVAEAWRRGDRRLLRYAAVGTLYLVVALAMVFVARVGYSGDYLIGLEGPARYFLVLYPLWTGFSVIAAHAVWHSSDRSPLVRSSFVLLVALTMLLAVQYQVRGLLGIAENRRFLADCEAALPADEPIATDMWWLPASLAPRYLEDGMYCVRQAELPRWAAEVASRTGGRFTFVSRSPLKVASIDLGGSFLNAEALKVTSGFHLTSFRLGSAPRTHPPVRAPGAED